MSPDIFSMLGGFALSMAIFTLLGRVIGLNTNGDRAVMSTGLYYILTGISVWYIVLLSALYFDQYMVAPLWWFFVLFVFSLFLILLREKKRQKVGEHFFTQIVLGMLILSPLFYVFLKDVPVLKEEFFGVVRYLQYIMFKGHIPPLEEGGSAGLNMFSQAPAYLATVLPSNLISQVYKPAVFALFNTFLFVLLSESLVRAAGIKVRWSNLPLVAAGGLLGMTFLNPFFSVDLLKNASGDLLFAAVFFAALLPLLREKNVPVGLAAIAPALVSSLLTGLDDMGIIAVALVMVIYIFRLFVDKQKISLEVVFAVSIMVALPALTWLMWQSETYDAALAGYNDGVRRWGLLGAPIQMLEWTWPSAVSIMLVLGVAVAQIFDAAVRQNLKAYMWVFVPAIIILAYVLMGVLFGQNVKLVHLQFIVLVPVWRWAMWWYEGTALKRVAYSAPWGFGLGLILLLMMGQSLYKNQFKDSYDDAMMHTFNTGRLLATEYLKPDDNVAVLEVSGREVYTLALLQYALANMGGNVMGAAEDFYEAAADLRLFHKRLHRDGVQWLWMHAPTPMYEEMLGAEMDARASYLFKVDANGLTLVRKLNHPSYDAGMLQKACVQTQCVLR